MLISIIWPAYPFRWGIAHHTNQFAKTLIKLWYQVSIYTFFRQYPHFLYPGKVQIEPPWTPNPFLKLLNFSFKQVIDTINPVSWYKTAGLIIKEKPDYCVIKYWHPYFSPCFTFIIWILRRHKIPIICIIDNLFPHERHFWDLLLARIFFSQVSSVVTQSMIVHQQFNTFFPHIPENMIYHPIYDQFWPPVSQTIARQKLWLPKDKKILLFFGFIRPYKWLDILLQILPELIQSNPRIHLVIAGECFGSFQIYKNIIEKFKLWNFISLYPYYISNSDIPIYFWVCDLLVMPYRSITNSGIENIGHAYASRSLLTVWMSTKNLKYKILQTLMAGPAPFKKKIISWHVYVENFLNWAWNSIKPNQ